VQAGAIGPAKRSAEALRDIAGRKATGVDELPIELIKEAGEAAVIAPTTLCQQI
jgi:hypothetical protein